MAQTSTERSKAYRAMLKEHGISDMSVRVHDDDRDKLRKYANRLLKPRLLEAGLTPQPGKVRGKK